MPASATITAYSDFTAGALIKSSEINKNFENHRGHNIPINPSAASAVASTYDLGSSEYPWRNAYIDTLVFATSTSALPVWQAFTFTHSDFQTAAASASKTILTSAAKGTIEGIVLYHTAKFLGGAISAYSMNVGTTATADYWASAYDGFSTSTASESWSFLDIPSFTGTQDILLTASATGANLDSSTAGIITVYVKRGLLP